VLKVKQVLFLKKQLEIFVVSMKPGVRIGEQKDFERQIITRIYLAGWSISKNWRCCGID
jgi:hypothetical protein